MARFKTINDIANQVAIEVGIPKTADVFASADIAFTQLTTLANSVGYELLTDVAWEGLVREESFVTQAGDSGKYELPTDFGYMINQTHWDRTNNVMLGGPLSAQEWTYLLGRDLVSQTIYATFREVDNQFWLFPQPPPEGLEITYEYTSRNWVLVNGVSGQFNDQVIQPADIVLYEAFLFERLLKVRFLEARGFDSTAAAAQYMKVMESWTAKDKGAPILNAGRTYGGVPYLDGFRNTPDTGFGG
jgi:hypothetical protein